MLSGLMARDSCPVKENRQLLLVEAGSSLGFDDMIKGYSCEPCSDRSWVSVDDVWTPGCIFCSALIIVIFILLVQTLTLGASYAPTCATEPLALWG